MHHDDLHMIYVQMNAQRAYTLYCYTLEMQHKRKMNRNNVSWEKEPFSGSFAAEPYPYVSCGVSHHYSKPVRNLNI